MRPFRADWNFIDKVEAELRKQFRKYLYNPIHKIFEENRILSNSESIEGKFRRIEAELRPRHTTTERDLIVALKSGRVQYWSNKFTGRFDAKVSRDLRNLGAQWRDKNGGYFYLPYSKIPQHVADVINQVQLKFVGRMKDAEKELSKITGLKVAAAFIATGLILEAIKKSEDDFQDTMDATNKAAGDKVDRKELEETAPAQKTDEEIADIWAENTKESIGDWADEEVKKIRQDLKGLIFQAENYGKRYAPKELREYVYQKYGTRIREEIFPGKQLKDLNEKELLRIEKRANLIARGEFGLAMTSYKYARAKESGANYFKWVTFPDNKVRPTHEPFNGNIYEFDNPPYDSQYKGKVLPQQAYNCRCKAIPIKLSQLKKDEKGNPLKKSDGTYILA